MRKLTTRLTAMLLSGMLVIGSAPGAVFAADAGETAEYAEEEVYIEDAVEESSEEPSDAAAEAYSEEEPSDAVEPYSEEVTVDAAEESSEAVEEPYPEGAGASEEEAAQYNTVILDANGGYFENEWDDTVGDHVEQASAITRQIPVGGTVAATPVFVEKDQDGQTMLFAGWSLEPGGEIVAAGNEEYIPVDSCTLYAVWEAGEGAGQEAAGDTQEDFEETVAEAGETVDESAEDFIPDDTAYEEEYSEGAAFEDLPSEEAASEDLPSEEAADAEDFRLDRFPAELDFRRGDMPDGRLRGPRAAGGRQLRHDQISAG